MRAILISSFAFLGGLAVGFVLAQATAAVRWFNERVEAERRRRANVEKVRAAFHEQAERESAGRRTRS
jgi:hypothetical protein